MYDREREKFYKTRGDKMKKVQKHNISISSLAFERIAADIKRRRDLNSVTRLDDY